MKADKHGTGNKRGEAWHWYYTRESMVQLMSVGTWWGMKGGKHSPTDKRGNIQLETEAK